MLCAVQVELTDMVYRKAMQLSGAEVARMGIGGIANLQSNDVQKMARFRLDINPLWDAPFQASVERNAWKQSTVRQGPFWLQRSYTLPTHCPW